MGQAQPGYPQSGYPQQGFAQPGYPLGYQGYGQPQFSGPPTPRKPKTGLVVLIVVIALVVIGGGTTALILLTKGRSGSTNAAASPSGTHAPVTSPGGRYQKTRTCAQLNGGPFTFTQSQTPSTLSWLISVGCPGMLGTGPSAPGLTVDMRVFTGPDAVSAARSGFVNGTQGGQSVSGTGFENAPYAQYDANAVSCTIDYFRSNEQVTLDFIELPGVTDLASCTSAAMPYARQYYKLIG